MDLSPKIRYSDMSYIIFHQWLKGSDRATFPIVYSYVYNKEKFDKIDKIDQQRSDTILANSLANSNKNDTIKNLKTKRRKDPANEPKRIRPNGQLNDDGNKIDGIDSVDSTNIDGIVPDRSTIENGSTNNQIIVDVHRQPVSIKNPTAVHLSDSDETDSTTTTKLLDKLQTDRIIDYDLKTLFYKSNQQPLMLDINHNRMSNDDSSSEISDIINERRQQFQRISVSSSSFSDDVDESTYATVELRRHMKNYDSQVQQSVPKSKSFPVSVNHQSRSENLGLNYVTERILASVLPQRNKSYEQIRPHSDGMSPTPQDIYEKELISMLEQKHGKNYKLFDLESCISTITLEKLCELCKHIDSWLGSGREKVVVLQDRGEKQRLGAAIAAYLEYLDICASNYPKRNGLSNEDVRIQNTIARNWLDLDIFSMKKFLEDVIGPLRVPSHRRYLQYFSGLLSGKIKMNSSPLFLNYVSIESPPMWQNYDTITSQSTEWQSFIKIYEGLNCVFTSNLHIIPVSTRQFVFEVGQLRLRGDVIIRCYQIIRNDRAYDEEKRELMFSSQFHTCAVTDKIVSFNRNELDYACDDPRFPSDHKVTLHFGNNSQNGDERSFLFQSPLVKIEPMNSIAKYDSLEDFDDDISQHTQGPLDGSLYATILKSPKSCERSPLSSFPRFPIDETLNAVKTPRTTGQTLISPPPEFSNTTLEVNENTISTSSSTYQANQSSSINRQQYTAPSTNISYEEIRVPSRSSSRDITLRSIYTTHQTPRPSSSQSQYQDQRSSSVSRLSNYTPTPNPSVSNNSYSTSGQQQQQQAIETYSYQPINENHQRGRGVNENFPDGRESVRSPLTLSMDSGISSSGIVNRRIQGSSVSPSSFPSQASPQEDRHRELDDILSDMLQTVQDIPDIGKSKQQILKKKYTQQQKLALDQNDHDFHQQATKQHQQTHQYQQYSTDTVKRLQVTSDRREDHGNILQTSTSMATNNNSKDIDLYDTSSTTTTITPPPSESGRDTPLISHTDTQHNIEKSQQQPSAMTTKASAAAAAAVTPTSMTTSSTIETIATMKTTTQRDRDTDRDVIMNLQNQSFVYPQQTRSEFVYATTSEDEEHSIPYHAREDSRPFTYGNPGGVQLCANGTGMLKMQSGLSSPSLVRKTLVRSGSCGGGGVVGGSGGFGGFTGNANSGSNTMNRKPNYRNDFEERLMQRREQILNEKYSIGDRTPNGGRGGSVDIGVSGNNKWRRDGGGGDDSANIINPPLNGYHYHEPLKRSNTMDGGFGRNNSGNYSDGSGQTWLQLQQQKLRMKRELEASGDRDYFERAMQQEIRSRPFRSRSSASHRYDGYASDTAAFDANAFMDEVDYRRPLRVQTPNRLSERIYHTLSTTNSIKNERPFVTVKRAHDEAKLNSVGSSPVSPLSALNASPLGHIPQAQSPTARNGLLSLADTSQRNGHVRLIREESFSSYRSETEPDTSTAGSPRPETPAFPVTPRTPYGLNGNSSPALPPKSPTSIRRFNNSTWSLRSAKSSVSNYNWSKDLYTGNQNAHIHQIINQNDNVSCYTSRRNSTTSNANSDPQEVAPHLVKFVRDSSKYWYKPNISRDEAAILLRTAAPGTFIVRDSTTYPNSFGLVLKVAHPPPGVQSKGSPGDELVRHFLVEPTTRGVRLKGCSNEPVFTSLSALVYQHSITPLALPCKLIIPDRDMQAGEFHTIAQQQLMTQGAACNVLYLFTCDMESLTGPEAIRKAISILFTRKPLPTPTEVHLKVSHQGITLTDTTRQLFFRKHYPTGHVSYVGLDPDDRRWSIRVTGDVPVSNKSIFAFVARRSASSVDNQCHVFCELEPTQPATAITSFAKKVIPTYGSYAPTKII